MLNQNEIICVHCKRKAELMSSNMKTVVICRECGTAMGFETYKELFDDMIYRKRDDYDPKRSE